jgi:hypothetical protein
MAPDAFTWGRGEIASIFIALVLCILGVAWHYKHIRRRDTDTTAVLGGLFGNALSVGPLLMIVLDPVHQVIAATTGFELVEGGLLNLMMVEGKTTLYLAAVIALVNTLTSFFRPRPD